MNASAARPGRGLAPWLRALASAGLLAGLFAWIDPSRLLELLRDASLPWLLLALALGLPQLLLSAWRWRLTAQLIGVPLPFGRALREYCLGNVLNQVLPGGVAGDLARAWRHAQEASLARAAWHAVLIERAAGQAVLLVCALLALPWAPGLGAGFRAGAARGNAAALVVIVLALLALLLATRFLPAIARFGRDFAQAVLTRQALLRQVPVSLALVGSYVGVYLCCARALGVETSALTLAPLVCWVLVAMALPLSLAGWGIREGAAAGVWLLAGLPVAEGVAISLLYGLVVLATALSGAALLLATRHAGGPTPSVDGS